MKSFSQLEFWFSNSPAQLTNLITLWRHNMAPIHNSVTFRRISTLFLETSVVFALYIHSSTRLHCEEDKLRECTKWRPSVDDCASFPRWLEKTAQRWQFISGMFVLFTVNLKAVSIFVEHVEKMPRSLVIFLSIACMW